MDIQLTQFAFKIWKCIGLLYAIKASPMVIRGFIVSDHK